MNCKNFGGKQCDTVAKTQLEIPGSHIRVLRVAPLPTQNCDSILGSSADESNTWVPVSPMGNMSELFS